MSETPDIFPFIRRYPCPTMHKVLTALLVSSVALAASAEEACRYLAYEGFNYPNNTPLHSLPGGPGWDQGWEIQGENADIPGYQINGTGSLSVDSLLTEGLLASGGRNYLTGGRKLDLSSAGPFTSYLTNGAVALNGKTLWISALLRKDQANDTPVWLAAHSDNTPWYLHNPRLGFGFFGSPSKSNGIRYWSIQINDKIYPSNTPITLGKPALLVLAVTFDSATGNTVRFFVNPPGLGSAESPNPDLTQTVSGSFPIRSLGLYLGSSEANGAVDEIRLADSWRCATPTATVPVDSPPIAAVTASVADGKAPLSVTFDGSGSRDAEGTLSGYEWTFGDGSPSVKAGQVISHTFDNLGRLRVALSVTDETGQRNTTYKTVIVRDEKGTFPCLSSISMVKRPSCGKSDGSFKVHPPTGASFQLTDASGKALRVGSANTYENLPKGQYRLSLSGADQCRDEFTVNMQEDPSTCDGWKPSACAMDIGMNLDGVNYYSRERAFRDYMKSAGTWIPYQATGPSPWNSGTLSEMPVDANGYPIRIPYPSSKGPQAVRGILSADGHMPPGQYVLLHDGEGSIQIATVADVVTTQGRISFRVQDENRNNIWFNLTSSKEENPIRNIRIVKASDEASYSESSFNPSFLDKLSAFKAIRFLNWNGTNPAQPLASWADRTQPGRYTQSGPKGVAFEYMIELGNTLKKDIWLTIPHTASDDYVRKMAEFFKAKLDPNLTLYIEYSNEVWNFMFSQSHWVDKNGPGNLNYPRKYVERAVHMFRLWQEVFGNESGRLKRVLNIQAAYPWYGREVLSHAHPQDYDYVSPAWYFSFGGACDKELEKLGSTATATQVLDCARQYYASQLPTLRQNYLNASLLGKEVINYEGGQHITGSGFERTFQPAIYAAQIDPAIYNLYETALVDLQLMGSKLAMAYQLAGPRISKYGSWGHLEDIDQPGPGFLETAPKFQSLLDNRSQCSKDLP